MELDLKGYFLFGEVKIIEGCITWSGRIPTKRRIPILPPLQILIIITQYKLTSRSLSRKLNPHKNNNISHITPPTLRSRRILQSSYIDRSTEYHIVVEHLVGLAHCVEWEWSIWEFLCVIEELKCCGFLVPICECVGFVQAACS